jgi:hypothetical protein
VVQGNSVPSKLATRLSQLVLEVNQRTYPMFVWHAKRRRLQLEVSEPLAYQLHEQRG